jgi:hypothetical protein
LSTCLFFAPDLVPAHELREPTSYFRLFDFKWKKTFEQSPVIFTLSF